MSPQLQYHFDDASAPTIEAPTCRSRKCIRWACHYACTLDFPSEVTVRPWSESGARTGSRSAAIRGKPLQVRRQNS